MSSSGAGGRKRETEARTREIAPGAATCGRTGEPRRGAGSRRAWPVITLAALALGGLGTQSSAALLPSATSLHLARLHRPDGPFEEPLWEGPQDRAAAVPDAIQAKLREVYALLGSEGADATAQAPGSHEAGLLLPPAAAAPLPAGLAPTAAPGEESVPEGARDRTASLAERLALPGRARAARIQPPSGFSAVDLHVHTRFSPDSVADPESMLLAAARRGLSGIAVTDHNTVAGAERALAIAAQLKQRGALPPDFLVIEGEEVGSRDGHIIALFVHAPVPPGRSAAETVAAIHAQGGLAVAAHPLLPSGVGQQAVSVRFDAVETENMAEELHFSLASAAANRRRAAFYRALTRPVIGSSDAHDPSVVGLGYTLIPAAHPDEADVRRALATHQTQAGMLAPARHLRRLAEATARPASSALREVHRLLAPGDRALREMTRADSASLRPGLLHRSFGWSLLLTRRF